ncbi:hypothetical protein LQD23_16475 [Chromobacterium violaceum]|uniref:hypothetical protein n=1 Tax=Chromobacterium violaceum TaxID=536 RepID=UPI001E2E6F66|nr:hypothetical protein [Chromobacterium violaceum]MCD0493878.1 hypothetical protein [Chromobacterium violaceum]
MGKFRQGATVEASKKRDTVAQNVTRNTYGIVIKKRTAVKPVAACTSTESVVSSAKKVIVEHSKVIKALADR